MRFHSLVLSSIVLLFAATGCAVQSQSPRFPLKFDQAEVQKNLAAQISTWISVEAAKAGREPTLVGAESVLLSSFGTAKIHGRQYLTLTADVKDAKRLGVQNMFPALVVCDSTGKQLVDIIPKHFKRQGPELDISPLGGRLIYRGGGTHDIVLIADPFCGFCREGFRFLQDNLAAARSVRIISFPLPMHPGARMAAYCMAYMMDRAAEKGLTPMDVASFAYTELQPVNLSGGKADILIAGQFLAKFPEFAPGEPAPAFCERVSRLYKADIEKQQRTLVAAGVQGTPALLVDGQTYRGLRLAEWCAALRDSRGASHQIALGVAGRESVSKTVR